MDRDVRPFDFGEFNLAPSIGVYLDEFGLVAAYCLGGRWLAELEVLRGIGNVPRSSKGRNFAPLLVKLLLVYLFDAKVLKDIVTHGMRGNAEIEEVICLMNTTAGVECAI
ncbi:hypothetical protein C7413_13190 [Paraburkholderia silvatlantica]|nr:hypothetical protein C7411_13190 [Paraburkholderia silvatlantica]PXW28959.1 hypothetical protein C7413_13190 [Paraburkholderia silvatlantica]